MIQARGLTKRFGSTLAVDDLRRPLSIAVVRTAEGWYVQRGGQAFPVKAELPSTASLLIEGLGAVRAAAAAMAGGVPVDGLSLLSPVTHPAGWWPRR